MRSFESKSLSKKYPQSGEKDFKADNIELATYVPKYTASDECMFQHSHKKPHLYKSLESGNGTKISDGKLRLVKPKYLEIKK